MKKNIRRVLSIVLVIAPLVWIYTRTSAEALAETLNAVRPLLLICILALAFFIMIMQGAKWWVLIRRFVPELRLGRAVSVHIESAFYAVALPTSAAHDVVRSVMLSRSHSPQVVWAATWLGKLIGFFVLILLSVFGAVYVQSETLPANFRSSIFAALAVLTVMSAASFSKKMTRPLRTIIAAVLSPKTMNRLDRVREGIYTFKHERSTLLQTFIITAAVQLLVMFMISLTMYAVTGKFYFIECLAFVPLIEIVALSLPLTPGGIGIREALMAAFFMHLGLSPQETASYVTISLMVTMLRLTGGVYPLYRFVAKRKQLP
ncbi:MAG: flippase-like domain-containing protein [Chitinispirillia bacterium]|nr:flippase-like domain-containing protein [Chitinispirillia bacterium]